MNKTLRYLFILLAITFIAPFAMAQYTTPGNNLSLTLDDLVTLSGGVVTTSDSDYFVNNTLIISATDTLKILQPETIRVAANFRIEVLGKFISDPTEGQVVFTAQDTTATESNFRGFRFEDADDAIFRNTVVKYGGGIQLIGTEAVFEYCVIRNNGFSNVSGAINYSGCSPVIQYCEFRENGRSAIASGANVTGSPQIIHNSFYHNTMDNSNRPQINIGPGTSDTIYIVGNYIEGLNDNAGGIAVSNNLSVGNTLALIAENIIVGNRYGYAQTGGNISSVIRDNIILDNDIQGNPMLGGSGLNFLGNTNNFSVVRNNIISGNLWGVTIQNTAQPEFGTAGDHGGNVFFDNGNTGQTYALYNNTPNPISAIGNYWGSNDAVTVESYIFHQPDDGNLGLVTYDPFMTLHPEILSFNFSQALNPGLDDDYEGVIDEENFTVHFMFPQGTDVSSLIPDIIIPFGAEITPDTGEPQDFILPVVYSVSVPHGDEQEWTVTVEVESEVSVPEFAAGKLNMYPNPAASYFMINMENAEHAGIMLNDLTGRTVLRKTIESSTQRIDVSHLPNGIYVVTLQTGTQTFVEKINIIK